MMLKSVLVFVTAAIVDVLWALYIRRTAQGAATPAAVYASLLFLAGAYNTMSYMAEPWLLVPLVLGAGVGTYGVVRYEARHRTPQ